MILVWGSEEDPPIADVVDELQARHADVVRIDNRVLAHLNFDVSLAPELKGWIDVAGTRFALDSISGIYLRPQPVHDQRLHAASSSLLAIASLLNTTVVNRPAAGRSNLSKPLQLSEISRAGFAVPPTLVTTDPRAAREFLAEHKRIIYKSNSGIRSIVAALHETDAARLAAVATGPVQLQRWIEGIDVRVHVVGQRCFGVAIESENVDYRYAQSGKDSVRITQTDVDDGLARQLIDLTASMGLLVAGIDLRITPNDEWVCFEVNPSPGFSFYEDVTGVPIAAAIADLLTGRHDLGERTARPAASKLRGTGRS
jgi:glutathione synthase/RimK-type ligase-like ATP-grasp enzyme